MMLDAETRLDDLTQHFVHSYLRPLLGFLADGGLAPERQRRRADRLVRALRNAALTEDLRDGGRRRVVEIDTAGAEPRLTFNARFVREVDGAEALGLLEEPVAELMEISPFHVGILFRLDDEESRRTVLQRARRAGRRVVGVAEIPSVIEMRLRRFFERLVAAVDAGDIALGTEDELDGPVAEIEALDSSEWPSWSKVVETEFIGGVLERVHGASDDSTRVPSVSLVAEICWESLDLSLQSALRRAGELLRAEVDGADVLERHLRTFGAVFSDGDDVPAEMARDWPNLKEVAEAWSGLFRAEQQQLSWASVRRETPRISVFEPPGAALHLDEPSSLPWQIPLICWSVRERSALCDLLHGHRESIRSSLSSGEPSEPEVDAGSVQGRRLEEEERAGGIVLQLEELGARRPSTDDERLARAVNACRADLLGRFEERDDADQRRVLEALRGAYDRYFERGSAVWERRFQSWRSIAPERAFATLCFEIQRVVGRHVLFDPFRDRGAGEVAERPDAVLVVAFREDRSAAPFRLPLALLRATAERPRLILRSIDVPASEGRSAVWRGDDALPRGALAQLPTEQLLEAIRDDAVELRLERRSST